MKNNTTVASCPYCKTSGVVIGARKVFIDLGCPKCGYSWTTLSAKCPMCKKVNGFAQEGLCLSCYKEGFRAHG